MKTIVLTGLNVQKIDDKLALIKRDYSADGSGSIEQFDGSELQDVNSVINAARNLSLLDSKKLLIIKNAGQSKDLLENIEKICTSLPDTTQLVLIDKKFDKRSLGYKYLQKHGKVHDFQQLASHDIYTWLQQYSRDKGSELTPALARFLVERVGNDQLRLQSEIDKLLISPGPITHERIETLTDETPQSKVFAMLDALFQKNLERAWRLYQDQRAQGEDPYKILAMIVWQLQQLTLAVHAPDGSQQAMKEAGLSPYSAQKMSSLAQHVSKTDLLHNVNRLTEIDAQSKTNAAIESALEVYFSEFASV
jgi:DNA polymerase-3 subunit delta